MKPERIQLVADENPPWTYVEPIGALSRELGFPSSDIATRFASYAEAVGRHHGLVVQAVETDGHLLVLVFASRPRATSTGATAGEDDLRACLRLLAVDTDARSSSPPRRAVAG